VDLSILIKMSGISRDSLVCPSAELGTWRPLGKELPLFPDLAFLFHLREGSERLLRKNRELRVQLYSEKIGTTKAKTLNDENKRLLQQLATNRSQQTAVFDAALSPLKQGLEIKTKELFDCKQRIARSDAKRQQAERHSNTLGDSIKKLNATLQEKTELLLKLEAQTEEKQHLLTEQHEKIKTLQQSSQDSAALRQQLNTLKQEYAELLKTKHTRSEEEEKNWSRLKNESDLANKRCADAEAASKHLQAEISRSAETAKRDTTLLQQSGKELEQQLEQAKNDSQQLQARLKEAEEKIEAAGQQKQENPVASKTEAEAEETKSNGEALEPKLKEAEEEIDSLREIRDKQQELIREVRKKIETRDSRIQDLESKISTATEPKSEALPPIAEQQESSRFSELANNARVFLSASIPWIVGVILLLALAIVFYKMFFSSSAEKQQTTALEQEASGSTVRDIKSMPAPKILQPRKKRSRPRKTSSTTRRQKKKSLKKKRSRPASRHRQKTRLSKEDLRKTQEELGLLKPAPEPSESDLQKAAKELGFDAFPDSQNKPEQEDSELEMPGFGSRH